MASLALGFAGKAVGTALGGPVGGLIGGFIGNAIGGMIDNQLFPVKQEGPRIEDRSVTASTYGQQIPRLYGPENRISPNMIWSTELIETAKKSKQGGKGGPSVQQTEYSYRVSCALAFAVGPIANIRKLWANGKLIFDNPAPGLSPDATGVMVSERADATQAVFTTMRFYTGGPLQAPDPTIESYLGVGETPAYRGTCYIVLTDLQLADYGNRIPNFEALIEAQESISVGAVVDSICVACGVPTNDVSTVGLAGDSVRGFAITQAAGGPGALQPLALAYAFDTAEQGGGLRFIKRGRSPRGRITQDMMGGHVGGDDRPEAVRFDRNPDMQQPRQASLTFLDPERNYQPNTQLAARAYGDAENNLGTSVALVLTADEGRSIVDRMLWEPWTARRICTLDLTDKFVDLRPGDVWVLDSPDPYSTFKCTRALRGANGLTETEWQGDDPSLYQSTAPGAASTVPPNPLRLPGPTTLALLNLPLLTDTDDPYGFYWTAAGSGAGWRGAEVLRSVDGLNFTSMSPTRQEATLGTVATALPDGPDLDLSAVVTVVLLDTDMQLESVSDDELAAGANPIWLGVPGSADGEVLQFRDADLIAPGTYELSYLVRGVKGTEFARPLHGADEQLVFLEFGPVARSSFGAADIGLARDYKAVSLLTDEADTMEQTFTNEGVGLRPYSPGTLGHTGGGASPPDDIVFTWLRRSRIGGDIRGEGADLPLVDGAESYTVEVRNAADTATLRTTVVTAPTWTYDAAMQAADFPGGLPATLYWRVAQASGIYGPGLSPWATATVV